VEKNVMAGQDTESNITAQRRFDLPMAELRLQTHIQNMQYLLFVYGHNGYALRFSVMLFVHCFSYYFFTPLIDLNVFF